MPFMSYQSVPMMNFNFYSALGMHAQSYSPVALNAWTNVTPSAPQQEYWLLDSGATNHMTSDLSNLQMATPSPSTETVTGAGGEGLTIAHIGKLSTCY